MSSECASLCRVIGWDLRFILTRDGTGAQSKLLRDKLVFVPPARDVSHHVVTWITNGPVGSGNRGRPAGLVG
ncbi:hypothetical protein NSND_61364 [Nitrospira sp. ND1]|nr:hypothetical protein NSND_61364 [Nitrospira sp. ND1]